VPLELGSRVVDLHRLDDDTINIRCVVNRDEFIAHIVKYFVGRPLHRVTKSTGTRLDVKEFITFNQWRALHGANWQQGLTRSRVNHIPGRRTWSLLLAACMIKCQNVGTRQFCDTTFQQGKKKSAEWAAFAERTLAAQGQKIVKEGETLETQQEQLSELTTQANDFSMKQLPILKALQVAKGS